MRAALVFLFLVACSAVPKQEHPSSTVPATQERPTPGTEIVVSTRPAPEGPQEPRARTSADVPAAHRRVLPGGGAKPCPNPRAFAALINGHAATIEWCEDELWDGGPPPGVLELPR
jgi:hypothetical protein